MQLWYDREVPVNFDKKEPTRYEIYSNDVKHYATVANFPLKAIHPGQSDPLENKFRVDVWEWNPNGMPKDGTLRTGWRLHSYFEDSKEEAKRVALEQVRKLSN